MKTGGLDAAFAATLAALGFCAAAVLLYPRVIGPVEGLSRARAENRALRRVESWPPASAAAARTLIERMGPPRRVSSSRLIWEGPPPWRRIAAARDPAAPWEHVLSYDIPVWARGPVEALGGGLRADLRRGELSVRGASEAANLLHLNLANEIVVGLRTLPEARAFRDRILELSAAGKSSPYLERLLFSPPRAPIPHWTLPVPFPEIGY